MQAFQYEAPATLNDALAALNTTSEIQTQVLAGGTDAIVQMRSRPAEPRRFIDIKKLAETNILAVENGVWRVGAAVPTAILHAHAEFDAAFPGLSEAADLIGSSQIQSRATLGGNLCNASPAADSVPALVALDAQCVIAGAGGTRTVAAADIPVGPGRTSLADNEFVVEFHIPQPAGKSADAYLRFIPRTEMDIAVVGAGVSLTLDDSGTCTAARVVLGAVGPTLIVVPDAENALIGSNLNEDALNAAAAASSQAATPISDKRGTVEYRRKVAGVLTRRSTLIAAERARAR
ncbi:MAG: xanthine dehydrogenase family protein subunit M [Pseudomonadota bacterium]